MVRSVNPGRPILEINSLILQHLNVNPNPSISQVPKVTIIILFPQLGPIWSATATDRLKRDLLKNYDKFARPAEPNATTACSIGLTVLHLEVDEIRSVMTLYSWIRMVRSLTYYNQSPPLITSCPSP